MSETAPTPPPPAARQPVLDWVLLAMVALVPAAALLDRLQAPGWVVFLVAVLATVPLAGFLGKATEEIAVRSTPAMGGLLNATFGNATELLICVQLLLSRDPDAPRVVRGSIVGSLVTNLLLLIGLSMFAGGLKYREQRFNPTAAGVSASLLIIAFAGVSIPSMFAAFNPTAAARVPELSLIVSGLLALVYACGLLFTLFTHRHLFDAVEDVQVAEAGPSWSVRRALLVLVASTAGVAWMAGVMARTLDSAGTQLGLSKTFVGVIVIGAITNVAENLSAIRYARRNLIDLSFHIGTSSTIQINLFVVPILVFVAAAVGSPFDLQFSLFELAAMLLPVMIINHLATDGVCNWLEGLQLVALYAIIGTAFYFVP